MAGQLPDILLDFQLETVKVASGGHSRRRVTHLVHDPALPPTAPPRLEIWESGRQRIGRGGQGDVLLQTCTSEGAHRDTVRAVKVIRSVDGDDRRRRVRELETMVRFSHERYSKFFVKMLGWYLTSGKRDLCIAMEYLPRGDLHSYLENRDPLGESDARQVITQVLQGLALMHKAGFAHRDIKPQNILIQQLPSPDDSTSWWVKLADFGISRRLEGTSTVTAIGTFDYMAPELLDGSTAPSKPDLRLADIWALGVTTFYIMTKDRAFRRWRSSVALDASNEESRGTEGRVPLGGMAFVVEATAEVPGQRLGWKDAIRHDWLGLPSQPAEPANDADDDESSVASWPSSSSSSEYISDQDERRDLATILTEKAISSGPVSESIPGLAEAEEGLATTAETSKEDTVPVEDKDTPVHDGRSGAQIKIPVGEDKTLVQEEDDLGPIMTYAAGKGDKDLITSLARQGADVSLANDEGLTPLHALRYGSSNLEAAKTLLELGAEIDSRSNMGATPLALAAMREETELVRFLVARGADVNSISNDGYSLLHRAITEKNREMVRILIELGADAHAQSLDIESSFSWAKALRDRELMLILSGAG